MLLAAVFLFGFISAFHLQYSLFPVIKNPALSIVVEYPGADSETVENTITIPLENQISAIGGISEIRSTSEKGKSLIRLDFENNVDIDIKTLEIKERIETTVNKFPKEVRKPKVLNFDPNEMPILVISLEVSNLESLGELRTYADTVIKKTFEGVEGVSKVSVSGGKIKEILISFDLQKLNAYNLSLLDLYNAIHFNNLSSTVATVEEKGGLYQVRLKGKFTTLNDLVKLPITSLSLGKTVSLGEIAKVSNGYRDEDSSYRVNGKENIGIYIYKKHSANLLKISSNIKNTIPSLNQSGPQLNILFNQADSIVSTYINAACIVFLTFILFSLILKIKSEQKVGILIGTTLFQLTFTYFLFSFIHFIFKIDFDLLSILSIYLSFTTWISLQFVFKDAIVQGENPKTQQSLILFTIVGIPGLFLPTTLLNETVATNLLRLSFLISVGVICNYLFFLYSNPLPTIKNNITIPEYFKNKNWKIENNSRSRNIALVTLLILSTSIAAFLYIRSSKEVYFNIEDDRVYGYIELPSDSSFSYTDKIVRDIEFKLVKNPKVKDVISQIDPSHAFLIINYHKNYILSENIIPSLNESVGKQNPAYCYFTKESELGRIKEISLDIIGSDHKDLNRSVPQVANWITNMPGIQEVILNFKAPRNELQLELNHNDPSVQNSEIGSFLKTVLQGSVVSKFRDDNNELDIRIRSSKEYRESEKQLNKFLIKNSTGQLSSINNLYTQKESISPIKLFRKNKSPNLSISIRTDAYDSASLLKLAQNGALKNLNPDERIESNNRIEKISKSNSSFIAYIILILAICFFLLIGFTESLGESFNYFLSLLFAYSIFLSLYLFFFKIYDISLHIGSIAILFSTMLQLLANSYQTKGRIDKKGNSTLLAIAFIIYLPLLLLSNKELNILKNVSGVFFFSLLLSKFFIFSFNFNYAKTASHIWKKISFKIQTFTSGRKQT
ncbi:efflux RND transporter permease subunit [Leptospira sp. WS92.C1]